MHNESQNFYQKRLEMTNKFSSVAGYRNNFHKSIAFPYIYIMHTEKEMTDAHLFSVASEKTKCLGINLTKVKDLYNKDLKLLKKEIWKDKRKWKDISAPGLVEVML